MNTSHITKPLNNPMGSQVIVIDDDEPTPINAPRVLAPTLLPIIAAPAIAQMPLLAAAMRPPPPLIGAPAVAQAPRVPVPTIPVPALIPIEHLKIVCKKIYTMYFNSIQRGVHQKNVMKNLISTCLFRKGPVSCEQLFIGYSRLTMRNYSQTEVALFTHAMNEIWKHNALQYIPSCLNKVDIATRQRYGR